jgi:hypothetical protein
MNTSFGTEDQGMSEEDKRIYDHKLLHILRDEIAEAYWQIFQPEPDRFTHVNLRIEKLMSFLTYAISKQLNDFDGWEETEELIAEYEHMFREEKMEVISNEEVESDFQDVRFHFNDGEDEEEIPF